MFRHRSRRRQRGQVIPITALAMISLIGGVALILEGGNAYAHQREAQNGSDAVANAGATVLAQFLGGTSKTDADVVAAMNSVSNANFLNDYDGYYTDVTGHWLTPGGAVTASQAAAARVGDGSIPAGAQGVQALGTQTFTTTFGRVIGFPQFTASADAISVSGALAGGGISPLVFPVNIVDCETNGDLGTGETNWQVSNPPTTPGGDPVGQEYIVPLCKTGSGSFMVLNLNPAMTCQEEAANPPATQFASFPVVVQSDNGNNCSNLMADAFNSWSGKVILIPICDGDCTTTGGSNATYHIIRVAAFFVDYFSAQNSGINAACVGNGTTLVPIAGNGSSSCIVGWFVRYITSGPVTGGPVQGAGAIGVQLVK